MIAIIPGTFGASLSLSEESHCTQCSGGKYCETTGLDAPTNNCNAGYYCTTGKNFGSFEKQTSYNVCKYNSIKLLSLLLYRGILSSTLTIISILVHSPSQINFLPFTLHTLQLSSTDIIF